MVIGYKKRLRSTYRVITELDILHVLKSRENFSRFNPLIQEHAITDHALKIINDMETFFKVNESLNEIDWSSFATWFKLIKNPTMKKADQEIYSTIFNNLAKFTPTETTEKVAQHFVALDYAGQISDHVDKFVAGKADSLSDVLAIVDKYASATNVTAKLDDEYFANNELGKIIDSTVRKGGLEWKLEDLNVGIGPLHRGDYVVVATRPETGKTTFALDQSLHMIQQMHVDDNILWINNEEDGDRINLRGYQSVLNKDLREILKDEPKAEAEYITKMGRLNRIRVYDKSDASIMDVERQCKIIKPTIIVFNVMDKIKGFEDAGNEVERLRKLFQWGRELAKKYGVVFALCQSDGSSEGQQWIFQDQIYGSKTGVQGEADVLITIGKVHDPKKERERYIHVPKNKLPGGPRTDATKKHGYFTVEFDAERAQFISRDYKKP
jgi:KaiC/GvpD/RAD55 family RecA-like ATPase